MKTPVVYEIAGNLRCLLVGDGQKISIGRSADSDVQIDGDAVRALEATAQFVNDCRSVVIDLCNGSAPNEQPLPWTLTLAGFDLVLYRPSSPAEGTAPGTEREITLQGLAPEKTQHVLQQGRPLLLGASEDCDVVITAADCPSVQMALWAASENKVWVQVLDNSGVVDWLGREHTTEAEMELPASLSLSGKMILIGNGNGVESYSHPISAPALTPAGTRTLAKTSPPMTAAAEFYINKNSEQHGPFSEEEVRHSVRQGTYSANDLAWKEGAEDWMPLNKFISISGPPRILPPPEGSTQNHPAMAPQIVISTNMVASETASPRGVIIASWVLIGLLCGGAFIPGLGFGTWALAWPFMLTTFILGIIALARRATVQGVMILLATIVVVPLVILIAPIVSTIKAGAAIASSEYAQKIIADGHSKLADVQAEEIAKAIDSIDKAAHPASVANSKTGPDQTAPNSYQSQEQKEAEPEIGMDAKRNATLAALMKKADKNIKEQLGERTDEPSLTKKFVETVLQNETANLKNFGVSLNEVKAFIDQTIPKVNTLPIIDKARAGDYAFALDDQFFIFGENQFSNRKTEMRPEETLNSGEKRRLNLAIALDSSCGAYLAQWEKVINDLPEQERHELLSLGGEFLQAAFCWNRLGLGSLTMPAGQRVFGELALGDDAKTTIAKLARVESYLLKDMLPLETEGVIIGGSTKIFGHLFLLVGILLPTTGGDVDDPLTSYHLASLEFHPLFQEEEMLSIANGEIYKALQGAGNGKTETTEEAVNALKSLGNYQDALVMQRIGNILWAGKMREGAAESLGKAQLEIHDAFKKMVSANYQLQPRPIRSEITINPFMGYTKSEGFRYFFPGEADRSETLIYRSNEKSVTFHLQEFPKFYSDVLLLKYHLTLKTRAFLSRLKMIKGRSN